MAAATTLFEKIWDAHVVQRAGRRHLPPLHRPPPRPRGDQPAGLRGPAPDRPQGAAARRHPRRARPQRADHRPLASGIAERVAHPGRHAGAELRASSASSYFGMNDVRQGIVHVIGPEQGLTLPGTTIVCGDSHTSTHGAFGALAFGIGTSRGRARAGDPDAAAEAGRRTCGSASRASLPLGVTAKDVILAIIGKIGTAGGTGYVIEYAGSVDPRPVDGRPHDGLQHVDRGGRARRPDRARRDHLRLSRGPAVGAQGRRVGAGASPTGARCPPTRAPTSTREVVARRRRHRAAGHLGHQPQDVVADHRRGARSRGSAPTRARARRAWSARSPTWASSRARRSTRSRSTRCSSAPAPTAASRTCAPPPRWSRGRKVARQRRGRWSCPGSGLVKHQAEEEGLDRDLPRGRLRMARGRLLDVPRHEPRPARARRALRLDLQPQLRGPPGQGRPHPPVSPAMAAAAALTGHLADVRKLV